MIAKDKRLRKICKNYELVENYAQAVADETNTWIMHYRNGICISKEELIRLGLYYGRPAGEFIFLTKAEHTILHNTYALPETRQKRSEAMKGENHPLYGKTGPNKGKQFSEETRKKMSEAKKGKQGPNKGKHRYTDGQIEICAAECPEGFVPGRLKK